MERTNFIKWCLLCALTMVLFSCQSKTSNNATEQEVKTIVPVFNADSCFSFLKAQTDFGARVPNTMAHKQCGDYLVHKLQQYGAQITEQEVVLNAYDGTRLQARNIIASWKSETNNRILLCAHWDSRPFCDEDPIPANRMQPVMGANDGASGVAVLLEIARLMAQHAPRVGVDIIFFDAEDYGSS
ncbi:MAG: M28 family peptidase, partial [Paludibacteraceae bacterium]|nr:M28 family peptidase [Paludibacteraceae bacterium]